MGNKTSDGEQTFPDAKILIGPEDYERDAEEPVILHAFRICTVVTTNGQLWAIKALAFTADEASIRKLWHEHPELFTKLDPNARSVPPEPEKAS